MGDYRKVLVTVPDSLLDEFDGVAEMKNITRSRLIRDAMILYIQENKRQRIRRQLTEGYKAMADINSFLAEECLTADEQVLYRYEQKLAESEK